MIAVLAGGVGAARFLKGLVRVVPPEEIVVIGNTGDDAIIYGLHVSPDLDTVTYTLAGASNPEAGWGIAGDTFRTVDALNRYGSPTWFRLGDLDLATNLYRTERLASRATLSEVTAEITRAWGIGFRLLPMSDDSVRTVLTLGTGEEIEFQEYFVHRRHAEAVRSVEFKGAADAQAAPGVIDALSRAEAVLLAPSNPVLSLGPILALHGVAVDVAEAQGARRRGLTDRRGSRAEGSGGPPARRARSRVIGAGRCSPARAGRGKLRHRRLRRGPRRRHRRRRIARARDGHGHDIARSRGGSRAACALGLGAPT